MAVSRFLIVEPDADTASILAALCHELRPATILATGEAVLATLASESAWTGVIMELELPDGSGLELLERIRARYPLLPVLVLTSRAEPRAINRVHVLRAEFHCKPTRRRALRGFLKLAVAVERARDARIARVIEANARRFALSPRESDILAAAVAGTARKILADQLGTTENTLKTQVRQLLRKCGHESLEELGRYVLHQAIGNTEPPACSGAAEVEEQDETGPPTIRPSTPRIRAHERVSDARESSTVRTLGGGDASRLAELASNARRSRVR